MVFNGDKGNFLSESADASITLLGNDMRSWIVAILLSFYSTCAQAQGEVFAWTTGWEIYFDKHQNICFSLPEKKSDKMLSIIAFYDATYSVSIMDKSLNADVNKSDRDVVMIAGSDRMKGQMSLFKMNEFGILKFYNANDYFFEKVITNNELFVELNNQTYGPFLVSGALGMLKELKLCRETRLQIEQNGGRDKSVANVVIGNKKIDVATDTPQSWTMNDLDTTFQFEGLTVDLSERVKPDGHSILIVDVTEDIFETVSFEIQNPDNMTGNIMLTRLNGGDKRSLIFTNSTIGGTEIRVVELPSVIHEVVNLGTYLNTDGLPVDAPDVYGRVFVLADDRATDFQRTGKISMPLKLLTVNKGKIVDVTKDDSFIHFYENLYNIQAGNCWNKLGDNPAACTDLLVTAAVLGVLDPTLQHIGSQLELTSNADVKYSICDATNCRPERNYVDAAFEAITDWGYVRKAEADNIKSIHSIMSEFVNRHFGSNDGGDFCPDSSFYIEQTDSGRDQHVYRLNFEEHNLSFTDGQIIGKTILANAVFMQIDGTPSLDKLLIGYNDSVLSLGSFATSKAIDLNVTYIQECNR